MAQFTQGLSHLALSISVMTCGGGFGPGARQSAGIFSEDGKRRLRATYGLIPRMLPPNTNAMASTKPMRRATAIVHLIAGLDQEAASADARVQRI